VHAVDALADIMTDEQLPVIARAEAARALAQLRPTRFNTARHQLRGLAKVENPLHRIQVLLILGYLDTIEAVPRLRHMASDRTLRPMIRLRCAEALSKLRRD
jgi:HEAT repeat protein